MPKMGKERLEHRRCDWIAVRRSPISVDLSRSSVPALHLFKSAQTETVGLLIDVSASS